MITQTQYDKLCAAIESGNRDTLWFCDVADLLESYEQMHTELDHTLMSGSKRVRVQAFELLYDSEGESRVALKKSKDPIAALGSLQPVRGLGRAMVFKGQ